MFNMIKKTNKNTCLTRLFIAVLLTLCGTFSAISEETISGNFIQPKDFEPGGQYHLFGSRGSVSKRYDTQFNAVTLSNIKQGILDINTGYFGARVKYDIDLSSYHPYQVHGSFSNSASRNASGKQGVTGLGFTAYQMNYHGYELHPHDAYDGGAGTGARDEYTYTMNGEVVSVSINNSLEKRPTRYEKMTELSKNFSLENVGSGIKKIYTTNPNLNGVGNKAEIINIVATGIVNSLDMGLTALGARDITTAVGIARDEATLRALNALPASSTVKATKVLAGTHEVIDESIYTITSIANDFANNNPNTAEVVKAGTTLVPTAKFIPKKIGTTRGTVYLGNTPKNDIQHLPAPDYSVPKYKIINKTDGTVVQGPKGGTYRRTGYYDSQGNVIFKDNNGAYYSFADGKGNRLNAAEVPNKTHGNTLGDQPTYNSSNTAEVVKVGTTLVPATKFIPKKIPKGVSNTAHPDNNFGKNNPNYSAELNKKVNDKKMPADIYGAKQVITESVTSRGTKIQSIPNGTKTQAFRDFDSLNLSNVKIIQAKKGEMRIGTLPDGRSVKVRPSNDSGRGRYTIEITKPNKKTEREIRYGNRN